MALDPATLPKDVAALTVLLLAENAARIAAETRSTEFDGQIAVSINSSFSLAS